MLRLVVFDLDGTLIDSRHDLCTSVNATLEYVGRAPLPNSTIASYIGDGASLLIRRALGDPEPSLTSDASVEDALAFFLAFYREHKLDHTFLYPGVLGSLAAIRDEHSDLAMAVLTNKPVNVSREICTHFGLDRFFFKVYGGNSFATKKPDQLGLVTLMADASRVTGQRVEPRDTLMVGDSNVDMQTARNAGARCLGCSYGFAPHTLMLTPPDAISESPADWPVTIKLAMSSGSS